MSSEEKSRRAWTGSSMFAKWMNKDFDDPNEPSVQRGRYSYSWRNRQSQASERTKLPVSDETQDQIGQMYQRIDVKDELEKLKEGR